MVLMVNFTIVTVLTVNQITKKTNMSIPGYQYMFIGESNASAI